MTSVDPENTDRHADCSSRPTPDPADVPKPENQAPDLAKSDDPS
jgi:hypothetical protein